MSAPCRCCRAHTCKDKFKLECLPGPFKGPLKTAKVVILALSAGYNQLYDPKHVRSTLGQDYRFRSRTGEYALPSADDHDSSANWSARIIRRFKLDYEAVRSKIAFLNIAPYKSKKFNDWPMLSALPSSRVALEFAQSSLFPEAQAGKKVVVCVRSARHWGLQRGYREGMLFAPVCGQGGIMNLGDERDHIIEAVQNAVRSGV